MCVHGSVGPTYSQRSFTPQTLSPSVRENEEIEFPLQIFIANEGKTKHLLKERASHKKLCKAVSSSGNNREPGTAHSEVYRRSSRKLSSNWIQEPYGKHALREQGGQSVGCLAEGLCFYLSRRSKMTTETVPCSCGTGPHDKLH